MLKSVIYLSVIATTALCPVDAERPTSGSASRAQSSPPRAQHHTLVQTSVIIPLCPLPPLSPRRTTRWYFVAPSPSLRLDFLRWQ
jgi:hypothetical protein